MDVSKLDYAPWKITRQLGQGSFGSVYEIQREEFGETYRAALKVISIPQSDSEIIANRADGMNDQSMTSYYNSVVQELTHEFALLSKLKGHTNIVGYEDHKVVPHADGIGWDIYIRMELLTSLTAVSAGHNFSRAEVIKLGMDICDALSLCEKKSIVHRDIKPDNIFISETGDFELGDFGIARTASRTVSNMSRKGTPNYMAPEVYTNQPYNSTVDIYSLGIVLYQLMNNKRLPFVPAQLTVAEREAALGKRMSGQPLLAPEQADPAFTQVILKACAFQPNMRYQTAEEMKQALEKLLNGEIPDSVHFHVPDSNIGSNTVDIGSLGASTIAGMGGMNSMNGQNMNSMNGQNMDGMNGTNGQNMNGMNGTNGQNMGGMNSQNMNGMNGTNGQSMGGMNGQYMGGMNGTNGQNMGGMNGQYMGGMNGSNGQNNQRKKPNQMIIIAGIAVAAVVVIVIALALILGGKSNKTTEAPAASTTTVSEPAAASTPATEGSQTAVPAEQPAPAEQQQDAAAAGQLSDSLSDYMFEMEGVLYQLPIAYSDFAATGWSLSNSYDDTTEETEIAANDYKTCYMTNGAVEITVYIYNLSGDIKQVKDCKIGGLVVYASNNLDFSVAQGINCLSTVEEIQTAYGTPTDTSSYNTEQTLTYQQDSYEYTEFQIDPEDTTGNSIRMMYFVETADDATVASTEMPDYLATYTAPTELGNDPTQPLFQLDGKLYRMPCPLSVFTDNGWSVASRDCDSIGAGNQQYGAISVTKDGYSISLNMANFAKISTITENCAVIGVSLHSAYLEGAPADFVVVPGNLNFGSSMSDLKKVCGSNTAFRENDSNEGYLYYTLSANPIYIEFYAHEKEDSTSVSYSILNSTWDY